MANRLFFCNTGWMENYQGITPSDKIVGGGKVVAITQRGSEVCNFLPYEGWCYGFVQPFGRKDVEIQIDRLGAAEGDNYVENVDVVLTALKPGGGTFIVGWYKDAYVFREKQALSRRSEVHKINKVKSFRFKAQADKVRLLSIDERTIKLETGKGRMGHANIWYADSDGNEEWLEKVRKLINSNGASPSTAKAKKPKGPVDNDRKVLVEKAAIEEAAAFFEADDYHVRSVETDNLGWDLEATKGDVTLLIEVKGRSCSSINAELTPNEYKALQAKQANYRLCIVTDCLSDPQLHVFSYNFALSKWKCTNVKLKSPLKITKKTGAIVSVGNSTKK